MGTEEDEQKGLWQRLKERRAIAGVVVGALVVFGLAWWLVPLALYRSVPDPKDRAGAEATTRAALLAGFVGLGALGTFWVNSRTLRITAQTADITAKTFKVTEQGHITDRYTKAIGQLGDDKLDVRLGGIYALERLAVDSARDHPTVVEVLSAFVRERSKPPKETRVEAEPGPATDVQAAVTVLGRLRLRDGVSRGDLVGATLPGADLSGANLTGAHLDGATLTGAHFSGADLTGAHLTGADLTGAHLVGAQLVGADLTGANLSKADLDGANLTNAHLDGANLTGAHLDEAKLARANLGQANLTGAHLWEANLTNAHLWGANLTSADLDGATLTGAHFSGADLTGAHLTGANLTGAHLDEAKLARANLGQANLTGAHLDEATLTGAHLNEATLTNARGLTNGQIAVARGDAKTTLPDGLTRPEAWI